MTAKFHIGELNISGSGSFSVTGLDFAPTGLFFLGASKSSLGAWVTSACHNFGIAVSGAQYTAYIDTNKIGYYVAGVESTSHCLKTELYPNEPTSLAVSSFNADGFTVTAVTPVAKVVYYLAVGGVTTAIRSFNGTVGGAGTYSVTGLSARPKLILTEAIGNYSSYYRALELGCSSGASNQWCHLVNVNSYSGTKVASSASFSDRMGDYNNTGGWGGNLQFTAFTDDGFTYTRATTDNQVRRALILAGADLGCKAGTVNIQAGPSTTVSSIGFTPKAILLCHDDKSAQADNAVLRLGLSDGTVTKGVQSYNTAGVTYSNSAWSNMYQAGDGLPCQPYSSTGKMTVTFGEDSFTVSHPDYASATPLQYVVLGEESAPIAESYEAFFE